MEPRKAVDMRLVAGGILVLAALAVLAGAYFYYFRTPAIPVITDTGTDTVGAQVSDAAQTPADKLPETNPFKPETNPYKGYKNPFD